VANHMSMSETFILPGIMLPYTDVCTVIKESLIRYPVFGIVMQATVPIVVQRADPRADLKEVLTSGEAMLRSGRSVLIFPQATRSVEFIPAEFNSLGAKLAAKGGVPLSPVALRTDYHGIGRRFRDFGPVDMTRPAHFAFGTPIPVVGNGRAAHEQAVTFIREKVKEWGVPVREKKVESPVTSPT
jgi:1-acyl-sn-glycerol-3-phosphate acyltransferase